MGTFRGSNRAGVDVNGSSSLSLELVDVARRLGVLVCATPGLRGVAGGYALGKNVVDSCCLLWTVTRYEPLVCRLPEGVGRVDRADVDREDTEFIGCAAEKIGLDKSI